MAAPVGMPLVRIRMRLEGEAIIDRVLAGIEDRASDLTPAWPGVLAAFYVITRQAFATEGASTGATWPQLKPRTQAERRRQGYQPAHPILQRTRALARALTGEGGAFASTAPRRLALRLSSEVDYFKYHQSTRPRRRLPRRAPVLLTADNRTQLIHSIRLYLTGRAPA